MRRRGLLQKVDAVGAIAKSLGCTPAQIALAYCLKNRRVASVLFGAKTSKQMEENLRALSVAQRLDDNVMNRLRAVTP